MSACPSVGWESESSCLPSFCHSQPLNYHKSSIMYFNEYSQGKARELCLCGIWTWMTTQTKRDGAQQKLCDKQKATFKIIFSLNMIIRSTDGPVVWRQHGVAWCSCQFITALSVASSFFCCWELTSRSVLIQQGIAPLTPAAEVAQSAPVKFRGLHHEGRINVRSSWSALREMGDCLAGLGLEWKNIIYLIS